MALTLQWRRTLWKTLVKEPCCTSRACDPKRALDYHGSEQAGCAVCGNNRNLFNLPLCRYVCPNQFWVSM